MLRKLNIGCWPPWLNRNNILDILYILKAYVNNMEIGKYIIGQNSLSIQLDTV